MKAPTRCLDRRFAMTALRARGDLLLVTGSARQLGRRRRLRTTRAISTCCVRMGAAAIVAGLAIAGPSPGSHRQTGDAKMLMVLGALATSVIERRPTLPPRRLRQRPITRTGMQRATPLPASASAGGARLPHRLRIDITGAAALRSSPRGCPTSYPHDLSPALLKPGLRPPRSAVARRRHLKTAFGSSRAGLTLTTVRCSAGPPLPQCGEVMKTPSPHRGESRFWASGRAATPPPPARIRRSLPPNIQIRAAPSVAVAAYFRCLAAATGQSNFGEFDREAEHPNRAVPWIILGPHHLPPPSPPPPPKKRKTETKKEKNATPPPPPRPPPPLRPPFPASRRPPPVGHPEPRLTTEAPPPWSTTCGVGEGFGDAHDPRTARRRC